ncbi:molybdopterin-binding protein [Candidatus Margulisiibacteriota bacterium]
MSEFELLSINTSKEKGTKKFPVKNVCLKRNVGIVDDAHKGMKNRELSLLSREEIDQFNSELVNGSFAENLTTLGLDLNNIKLLDYLQINNVLLQVSKIGKECHDRCHIYKSIGDCIMPKKGVFCKVIKGGKISQGEKGVFLPKKYKVAIITLSDRASQNVYADKSGEQIKQKLDTYFSSLNREWELTKLVIPDSKIKLWMTFFKFISRKYDLIITTGGTGVSKKDITVEIAKRFIKKELSGITEHIRIKYGQDNKNALASRSLVGVNDKTIICCLPGSVKAVSEYMDEIMPMLGHLFFMIWDVDGH